jgi:hypothetical protein
MIKIPIMEIERNTAIMWAEAAKAKADENGLHSRFNTNEIENKALGKLGELLIRRVLRARGVVFTAQDKIGEADDYDILIKGVRVDVKASLRKAPIEAINDSYQLMVLDKQLEGKADVYAWILIQGANVREARMAYWIGWLPTSRIGGFPIVEKLPGVPARWIPVQSAGDPERFIDWSLTDAFLNKNIHDFAAQTREKGAVKF